MPTAASAPTADAAPAVGPGDLPELPHLPSEWRRGVNAPDVHRGGKGGIGVQVQQLLGNVHKHADKHREALAKLLNMRPHTTSARTGAELCGLNRIAVWRVLSKMRVQEWQCHQPARGGGATKMWGTNNV